MKYLTLKNSSRLMATSAMWLVVSVFAVQAETIRLWTTEEQPDRLAKQQEIAADFETETGTKVEVIPVTESDLGTRVTAALAANDLPDVIYHTLQYALPWAEAGILDTEAATEVIEDLGPDTFAKGALDMVAHNDEFAAVPVDGWTQIILYRKDLFEAAGLASPTSYANVMAALEKLHNPPEMYGFVSATKVDENYMSQILEHIFLANGVSPVDENGFRPLDEAKTLEVLEFYKALTKASPPGDLYWKQSREVYFSGKAAMIIWSPFILDELAGLRDSDPPMINGDPTTRELASNTGIITNFSGPSNPDGAAWGDVRYFGITMNADTAIAQEFVSYSMNEGYIPTLSIAPEGKHPVRKGTAAVPTEFLEAWATLPVGVDRKAPLDELYPSEAIDEIINGLDQAQRWGAKEGQLSRASKMNNTRVINQVVRRFLDDEIDAKTAVLELNEKLALIE